MDNKINKFTKISTERIRKTKNEEVKKEVGAVCMVDKESGKTVKVEKHKVKDVILDQAKSGESLDHFNKRLKNGIEIKDKKNRIEGNFEMKNDNMKFRNSVDSFMAKINDAVKKIIGKNDYQKIKQDQIDENNNKRAA